MTIWIWRFPIWSCRALDNDTWWHVSPGKGWLDHRRHSVQCSPGHIWGATPWSSCLCGSRLSSGHKEDTNLRPAKLRTSDRWKCLQIHSRNWKVPQKLTGSVHHTDRWKMPCFDRQKDPIMWAMATVCYTAQSSIHRKSHTKYQPARWQYTMAQMHRQYQYLLLSDVVGCCWWLLATLYNQSFSNHQTTSNKPLEDKNFITLCVQNHSALPKWENRGPECFAK